MENRCAPYGQPVSLSTVIPVSEVFLQDGWVQFDSFDAYWGSATYNRWVPMNTTGLNMTGNNYNPFDDLTDGKGGWRLTGDESSEIMFALAESYSSYVNSSITVGNQSA